MLQDNPIGVFSEVSNIATEPTVTTNVAETTQDSSSTNNTKYTKRLVKRVKMTTSERELHRKLVATKQKVRRFTLEEKMLALALLKQSPKAYRFLRKIFILVSRQILIILLNQANIKPENPAYKGIRLIPKLSDDHVLPQRISKIKVKHASQVFSRTVSSNMGYLADKGILPPECKETADLLLFFDNLFESVNGSFKKNRNSKQIYRTY